MGSPQHSDIHVDKPLSNLSIVLTNPAFKALELYPEFFVKNESDKYYVYKNREGLSRLNVKRADGTESNTFDFKPTTESYICQEQALHKILTDRKMNNADSPTRLRANAVRLIQSFIDLDHEFDVMDEVSSLAGLTGSTPAVKWNAGSGTINIEGDLDTAKQSILDESGAVANKVLFNDQIKDVVKKDSTLRNLIRYTIQGDGGQRLLVDGELPPVMFNLKIVVAASRYNTAQLGQTPSISRIWDSRAIVGFVDPSPGEESRTLGLTFTVRGAGVGSGTVKTWRDNPKSGTVYEISKIRVAKTVASGCGYNLHSVLTG
ncbi:MAG: hypothetical protein HOL31_13085 [Candidatus Scalindua sp.]|jgi:hypothetical protein|nr:hypothetical protein [Candidatus Scalindua sp.]